jgi:tRNA-specific 2-thiouridylase
MHPARLIDENGEQLGSVDAVELVTIGQRRGLGIGIDGRPRYAIDVDVPNRTVLVGAAEDLDMPGELLRSFTWVDDEARLDALSSATLIAQLSAHGDPVEVSSITETDDGLDIAWSTPHRRVAPGQSIVLYENDLVMGGGIVRRR